MSTLPITKEEKEAIDEVLFWLDLKQLAWAAKALRRLGKPSEADQLLGWGAELYRVKAEYNPWSPVPAATSEAREDPVAT